MDGYLYGSNCQEDRELMDGFINGPDGDVLVHYRSIEPAEAGFKNLNGGDQVEFSQIKSAKGWQAAQVSVVQSAETC